MTTLPAAVVAPRSVTNLPRNSCSLPVSIAMMKLPLGCSVCHHGSGCPRALQRRCNPAATGSLLRGLSGLSLGGPAQAIAPDEPAQDFRWPGDLAAGGLRLDLVGLVRVEVARVLVDIYPGVQAGHVEFGVKLGRVDVGADPERLHRAGRGAGQQHGMPGQPAD